MNLTRLLSDPDLRKAMVIFASGYSKRMAAPYYAKLLETDLGRQAMRLNWASKLTIEAVLNGVVAYVATKENAVVTSPFREFLWEMLKDAPSELSRQLLADTVVEPGRVDTRRSELKETPRETGEIPAKGGDEFITWLDGTTKGEREEMLRVLMTFDPKETRETTIGPPPKTPTTPIASRSPQNRSAHLPTSVLTDLDDAHRRLDEELRDKVLKRKVTK